MTLTAEIVATAELCGTVLSEPAAALMVSELKRFPEEQVRGALSKCRRELKGRLTVAEILSRLDDGRPGADEAWAMLPWREEQTAILTAEMQQAQGAAWDAYNSGDKVGARYAFKEAYTRLVNEAREQGNPVDWQVSLGWDKAGREGPIREALALGRLSYDRAARLLPGIEAEKTEQTGIDRIASAVNLIAARKGML